MRPDRWEPVTEEAEGAMQAAGGEKAATSLTAVLVAMAEEVEGSAGLRLTEGFTLATGRRGGEEEEAEEPFSGVTAMAARDGASPPWLTTAAASSSPV